MERRIILAAGVFLLLLFFMANAYGNGGSGVILQPVQKPASGQAYARLETIELWLVHTPDNIRNREARALIDGKEIVLSLKNVTFCEIWQMPAEVWAANISLSNGEHTCQYFYVQSIKQSGNFWADSHVYTTKPFEFYVVGEEQYSSILKETQTDETVKDEDLTGTSATLDLNVACLYLLLAVGLSVSMVKARNRLTTAKRENNK
ncbi:MAG: hypothetical protein QXU21_04645 [Candidatus Bathyarchaeia archaeon]